jgi:hypothetical protein
MLMHDYFVEEKYFLKRCFGVEKITIFATRKNNGK